MRNRTHNKVWRRYEGKRNQLHQSPYYVAQNEQLHWCVFRDMPSGRQDVMYMANGRDLDSFIDAQSTRAEMTYYLNRTQ